MNPLKLIRKLGKLIRGGAGPKQIFLGCLLGVLVGMTPGLNLTLVLAIALLVILNANGGLAALGIVLGKALQLLLAPVTFQVGYTIIHNIGLEGLFRTFAQTPVLALMDLHVYSLAGGIPIALIVGLVYGAACNKLITGIRAGILKATDKSETFAKIGKNWFVRLIVRLVFGKQKGTLAELAEKKDPFFRKSGVIFAVVLLVIAAAAELLMADWAFKKAVVAGLESAVGAEVNIADADLSILGGEVRLAGIQVTDPDKPTHNMIYIDKLYGDLGTSDLLTKQVVINKVEVSVAQTDVPRESPGKVYQRPAEPIPEEGKPQDAVSKYVKLRDDLGKYRGYAEKIADYLKKQKAEREQQEQQQTQGRNQRLVDEARNRGYLALSAQEILTKRPTWTIAQLIVDQITVAKDGKTYKLEAQQLSSNPALNDAPMKIAVSGPDNFAGNVTFDFSQAGAGHRIRLNAPGVPIGDAIGLSDNAPVSVAGGTADIKIDGTFTADSLNIPVTLNVTGLQAQAREGEKVLGLDPATAQEVFASLKEIALNAEVYGKPDSPRVRVDEKQLLASLKESLIKAGKAELANRANRELEKLKGQATEKIQGKIEELLPKDIEKAVPDDLKKKVDEVLPGALDGLLKPKDKKDGEKEDTGEQPEEKDDKEKAKDLLKKLF